LSEIVILKTGGDMAPDESKRRWQKAVFASDAQPFAA
jgi:hypothetical protein